MGFSGLVNIWISRLPKPYLEVPMFLYIEEIIVYEPGDLYGGHVLSLSCLSYFNYPYFKHVIQKSHS